MVSLETGEKFPFIVFILLCGLTVMLKLFLGSAASSRFDVLAEVAEEIKGKGTIAYINCG